MRVIMLDFDGVLNSVSYFIYNNRQRDLGLSDVPTHKSFDPIACSNLLYILEKLPDVKIVVSSTWRKYSSLEELKDVFKFNYLPPESIVGKTPVCESRYRGDEIMEYLSEHPEVTDFVIIDDDTDMAPYMEKLVKTNNRDGLTLTDADEVIKKFGAKNEKK